MTGWTAWPWHHHVVLCGSLPVRLSEHRILFAPLCMCDNIILSGSETRNEFLQNNLICWLSSHPSFHPVCTPCSAANILSNWVILDKTFLLLCASEKELQIASNNWYEQTNPHSLTSHYKQKIYQGEFQLNLCINRKKSHPTFSLWTEGWRLGNRRIKPIFRVVIIICMINFLTSWAALQ